MSVSSLSFTVARSALQWGCTSSVSPRARSLLAAEYEGVVTTRAPTLTLYSQACLPEGIHDSELSTFNGTIGSGGVLRRSEEEHHAKRSLTARAVYGMWRARVSFTRKSRVEAAQ